MEEVGNELPDNIVQETPLTETEARAEALTLRSMMEQLKLLAIEYMQKNPEELEEVEGLRVNYDLQTGRGYVSDPLGQASTHPVGGVGDGRVNFSFSRGEPKGVNEAIAKELRIDTSHYLDIYVHGDIATIDQAREIWEQQKKGIFGTRYFFDPKGGYGVVAAFPAEIQEKSKVLYKNPSTKYVETTFSKEKANTAGFALTNLKARIEKALGRGPQGSRPTR